MNKSSCLTLISTHFQSGSSISTEAIQVIEVVLINYRSVSRISNAMRTILDLRSFMSPLIATKNSVMSTKPFLSLSKQEKMSSTSLRFNSMP